MQVNSVIEAHDATKPVESPEMTDIWTVSALRQAVLAKLTYSVGKSPAVASERDWFVATAFTVRDRIVESWMTSRSTF